MPRPSPSTSRVIAVLNFLADHPREFFSLSELSRQLDLNKATAHGLLGELSDAGYVFRDNVNKTFSLGPALVALGQAAVAPENKIIAFAHPEMETLADAVGGECLASTLIGDEVVIVATAGSPVARATSDLGYRSRLYPPHGMVFVAWASSAKIEAYLANISEEAEKGRYRQVLETVRDRGYSLAVNAQARAQLDKALLSVRDQALTPEVHKTLAELASHLAREEQELTDIKPNRRYPIRSMSAPVFDAQGAVRLALILRGFPELVGSDVRRHAEALVEAAGRVSDLLGGRRIGRGA